MEDFSALPRLFRDAIVNELWEGPRNVLLTQIYRDLQRVSQWFEPAEFVSSALDGAPREKVYNLSTALERLLTKPVLTGVNEASLEAAGEWEELCDDFFKTYQVQAMAEAGEDN